MVSVVQIRSTVKTRESSRTSERANLLTRSSGVCTMRHVLHMACMWIGFFKMVSNEANSKLLFIIYQIRPFNLVCYKVLSNRKKTDFLLHSSNMSSSQLSLSTPVTPMHRSFSTSGYLDNSSFMLNPYVIREFSGSENGNLIPHTPPQRQKSRRKSSIFSVRIWK